MRAVILSIKCSVQTFNGNAALIVLESYEL